MDNKVNVKLLSMLGQGGSAFGISLMNIMNERDDIMVLSADMSAPAGLDKFKSAFPNHFLNVGIAEQNMIGVAAGLADEGFKVICVAQACFITMRCYEQVRHFAGYMNLPIILVGIGAGLSLQFMGNTHYALEDVALMRTIPDMTVMAPCDSLEAMNALEYAVSSGGAAYIRLLGGTGITAVHQAEYDFGKGKPVVLSDGKDVTILATGAATSRALAAAQALDRDGIACTVVDVVTLKPFDRAVLDSCRQNALVVTVEEHRLAGGLGTIVAECFTEMNLDVPLLTLGVGNDLYPNPGFYQYMVEQCGLDAESVAIQIKKKLITLK